MRHRSLRSFGQWARRAGICFLFGALLFGLACRGQPRIRVVIQQTSPLLEVAAREVASRLAQRGYRVEISTGTEASAGLTDAVIVNVGGAGSGLKPESFEIRPIQSDGFVLLRVTGADARSAYWGALEAADQIVAGGDPNAVQRASASAYLSIRASQATLPLAESLESDPAQLRERWKQYFDLLVRNRFNSVFFEARENLLRYTEFARGTAVVSTAPVADKRTIERLRELFRLARERGLSPYLTLDKSCFAEWFPKPAPTPESAEPVPAPPLDIRAALPSVLHTYPDLAGVALSADVEELAGPVDKRAAWLVVNVFLPLAEKNERRPVFLGTDGEWWPDKAALGSGSAPAPVYLLASIETLGNAPAAMDIPVLWQVVNETRELRPWQDPNAVRETLLRIGAKKSVGFVESDFEPVSERSGSDASAPVQPPNSDQNWFRMMLWGRLGYSPEVSGNYWEQQFGSHFASGAGAFVSAAAIHSNRILTLFGTSFSAPDSKAPAGVAGGGGVEESSNQEQAIFRRVSGSSHGDLITDAMAQQGLLIEEGQVAGSSLQTAEAIEREARQALTAAAAAASRGAWRGAANEEFYGRIQAIAGMGSIVAETVRASQLLARFVLGGGEDLRQQALRSLERAQKALGAEAARFPMAAGIRSDLASRAGSALEIGKQLKPWQWERTNWEVGAKETWQPASFSEVPLPQELRRVQTSRLVEFGAYGRQSWMAAINQHLRTAFLPVELMGNPVPGALLVGKASISARRNGRLVVRAISEETVSVWVDRHRATRLPPQQFPWIPSSEPASPLKAQLFWAPIETGNHEVLVAASVREKWPRIAASFLLPPDPADVVTIQPQEPSKLEGGLVLTPASESAPQPFIGLAERKPGEPFSGADTLSMALYRFRVRNAGLYRMRLWSLWKNAASAGLVLALDGSVLKRNFGRGDGNYQKWHWAPVEGIVDLGAGEHSLTISGWKPGAALGTAELHPAW